MRWAVEELVAAEVYPTLILAAAHILRTLDTVDPYVTSTAHRAREAIEALDSLDAIEERMSLHIAALLEETE